MMEFQYRKMVQEIADTVLNDIPFREWIDNVNNAYANKKCNLTFCRYNTDRECTNDEKRKECVEVAEKVLCVDKEKFMDEIREASRKVLCENGNDY